MCYRLVLRYQMNLETAFLKNRNLRVFDYLMRANFFIEYILKLQITKISHITFFFFILDIEAHV